MNTIFTKIRDNLPNNDKDNVNIMNKLNKIMKDYDINNNMNINKTLQSMNVILTYRFKERSNEENRKLLDTVKHLRLLFKK